jgi:6-pyruvoyltetrahydropterin/6-carboxytetrahydropterin synthase
MLLTVSKRVEFSTSRRLYSPALTAEQNLTTFGPESAARYGTGRNYVGYFVFTGEVNADNGMLINISEIKERVGRVLHDGFDHKFLNEDNSTFAEQLPTTENVARELFAGAQPLFAGTGADLVACHLSETPIRSATAYAGGAIDSNHWFEFSAARQTMSPHLSREENERLFGIAASPFGHGHHYRARLTARFDDLGSDATLQSYPEIRRTVDALRSSLDHRNLNAEVAGLTNRPITTESLARYIREQASSTVAVERVRLHERDDFFAESWSDGRMFLGMQAAFSAAHRLHSNVLAAEENVSLYGKCNNERGHGHRYVTEATISGQYDERSGTLFDFVQFQNALADSLEPWQDKHLDLETDDFRDQPSTGENIVRALWPKVDQQLNGRLTRLRLWETPNNRFTLRRLQET